MANYDLVMPYITQMEAWLAKRKYPHPKAGPQNRLPTKQEIIDAISSTGTLRVECADDLVFFAIRKEAQSSGKYEVRIGCSNWKQLGKSATDLFTMHGGCIKVELELLEILSHNCGQLLLYPDTGSPAVIVGPGMDTERTSKLWAEAIDQDDSWGYFYGNIGY